MNTHFFCGGSRKKLRIIKKYRYIDIESEIENLTKWNHNEKYLRSMETKNKLKNYWYKYNLFSNNLKIKLLRT